MSPLRLNGSTSGYSQIDAPAIAGDQTFTLPGTGGTLDRLNRVGNVIQVVSYQTGAAASGTTTIPIDDTIPQNTEGTEFMTLAITPTSASNKLFIEVVLTCTINAGSAAIAVALFQDSTANALAANFQGLATSDYLHTLSLNHYMTAGTTSYTTFKVRAGSNFGSPNTFRINGNTTGSNRYFGGVMASTITITEIAA